MIVQTFTRRDHAESSPRWFARAEHDGVTVTTATYATELAAASKAIAMVRAAIAHGESGRFQMADDGSHRRIG
jgi:hypothetical protein